MKRPPRALPTQDRAKDTVGLLLDATEAVSREVGYEAATTKRIAQVAGVSAGTLYRYFPTKDDLLKALLRRHWDAGLRSFGESLALVRPGAFGDVVEAIVELAFRMVASRLEALGKMRIETNNLVHLDAELIHGAAMLVQGALESRRAELVVDDLEVAGILVARAVVFLARVGIRDYDDLVRSERYPKEVARMVRRYLVGASA